MLHQQIENQDVDLDVRAKDHIAEMTRDCDEAPKATFTGTACIGTSWSETHVSGGNVYSVGRSVSSTPINIMNINGTKFWIRRSDGAEKQFAIGTEDINFRDGHMVTAVVGASGNLIGVYNHATKSWIQSRGSTHNSYVGLLLAGSLFATGFGILLMCAGWGTPESVRIADPTPFSPEAFWTGVTLVAGNFIFIPLARAISTYNRLTDGAFEWIAREG